MKRNLDDCADDAADEGKRPRALGADECETISVPKGVVEALMISEHRTQLTELSGAQVGWSRTHAEVGLVGSGEQVRAANRLLARVSMQKASIRMRLAARTPPLPDYMVRSSLRLM